MIIVIGATSFIGVHTVTELVNQGCEVLVTGRKDRFKEHYEALGVKYVNLDLDKEEDFNQLPTQNVEGVYYWLVCFLPMRQSILMWMKMQLIIFVSTQLARLIA